MKNQYTEIQMVMKAFLQSPKRVFTSDDFRNGVYVLDYKFVYDYLPRQIHDIQKIKLPSGERFRFDKMKNFKGRCTGYKLPSDLTTEDFIFLNNSKNIRKIKILKRNNVEMQKACNMYQKVANFFR